MSEQKTDFCPHGFDNGRRCPICSKPVEKTVGDFTKVQPFTCFKCGNGNTLLFCLNCADEINDSKLRDTFAATAMAILLADHVTKKFIPEEAYYLADAMMAERERRKAK